MILNTMHVSLVITGCKTIDVIPALINFKIYTQNNSANRKFNAQRFGFSCKMFERLSNRCLRGKSSRWQKLMVLHNHQSCSTCTWKQCTRTRLLSTCTCIVLGPWVLTYMEQVQVLNKSVFVFSITLPTTMEFFKSIRIDSMLYCSVLCLCKMCNRLTLPTEIVRCSSLTIGHQYQQIIYKVSLPTHEVMHFHILHP